MNKLLPPVFAFAGIITIYATAKLLTDHPFIVLATALVAAAVGIQYARWRYWNIGRLTSSQKGLSR